MARSGQFDYNPAESKRLLASLGLKDGNGDGDLEDAREIPTFSLKTNSSNKMRIAMVNFIKDDFEKVGISVSPTPVDFNTLVTNLHSDFQYQAMLLGIQSGVPPDPSMMQNSGARRGLRLQWSMKQSKPYTPQDARIDHLMDAIIATHDSLSARKPITKSKRLRTNGLDDLAA